MNWPRVRELLLLLGLILLVGYVSLYTLEERGIL